MKLKYLKPGTLIFILCAGIGVLLIFAGSMQQDYSIGKKAFCYLVGVVLILISLVPFVLRRRYWASIKSVQVIDVESQTSTGSAVARGVVGDLVAGPAGAMIGAATAKQNKKTTFLIVFKSGKNVTKVVPNDHPDYKKYMALTVQ